MDQRMKKKKRILMMVAGLLILSAVVLVVKGQADWSRKHAAPSSPVTQTDGKENEGKEEGAETSKQSGEEDNGSASAAVLSETQQKAVVLYDQGLELYYDRQFDQAIALFDQALGLDPQCYQAMNGKGASYAFLGRYEEGINLIKQAITLKPDFVYAHFNLGLAYELAGEWDAGIKAYKEALVLDDKDVWSYYGIASIYGRQGNVEKVVEYLRPAIDLQADVKDVAKEEKDFDPVKNDPRFQTLVNG